MRTFALVAVSGLTLMACANPYIPVATQIDCATAFLRTFGNEAYKDLTPAERGALALRECKVLPNDTLVDADTGHAVATQPAAFMEPVLLLPQSEIDAADPE